jgi:hypothetical protein
MMHLHLLTSCLPRLQAYAVTPHHNPVDAACRFEEQIVQTAHSDKISGLAFPHQYAEVFATCSLGCIRVWHLRGCRELLRVSLPNLECRCLAFTQVQ